MDKKEFMEIVKKKEQAISWSTDEYFDLWFTKTILDGRFSSEELRMIADAMDELKKIAKDNGVDENYYNF